MVFGLCIAVAACGSSSESVNRGGVGESCTSHNDCKDGLGCFNYLCSQAPAPVVSPDGGTSTPVTPTVLSGPGESCTKRADCVSGYGCFSGICALTAPVPVHVDAAVITVYVTVDAGPVAPTNPVLGARGETCGVSADCEKGLICLPISDNTGLGICDIANYGYPTGANSCYAECKVDSDCCELPLGTAGTPPDAGTVTYNSCADLVKVIKQVTAGDCADQASISHECFLFKTYCDCAASATSNPWKCTAVGKCSYSGICDPTVTGEIMKGCPAKSRASFPVDSCNTTTKRCAAVAATGGCTTDAECTGLAVADAAGETCSSGECACVTTSGTCYRKCNAELDCKPGYTCDATQHLCKPAGSCTTDAFCAVSLKNAGAKCAAIAGSTAKTCRLPCQSDQDCSPSGLSVSAPFTGSVCGTDKYCGSLGCTSDAECSIDVLGASGTVLGGVKMFCAPPVAGSVVQWASAITD